MAKVEIFYFLLSICCCSWFESATANNEVVNDVINEFKRIYHDELKFNFSIGEVVDIDGKLEDGKAIKAKLEIDVCSVEGVVNLAQKGNASLINPTFTYVIYGAYLVPGPHQSLSLKCDAKIEIANQTAYLQLSGEIKEVVWYLKYLETVPGFQRTLNRLTWEHTPQYNFSSNFEQSLLKAHVPQEISEKIKEVISKKANDAILTVMEKSLTWTLEYNPKFSDEDKFIDSIVKIIMNNFSQIRGLDLGIPRRTLNHSYTTSEGHIENSTISLENCYLHDITKFKRLKSVYTTGFSTFYTITAQMQPGYDNSFQIICNTTISKTMYKENVLLLINSKKSEILFRIMVSSSLSLEELRWLGKINNEPKFSVDNYYGKTQSKEILNAMVKIVNDYVIETASTNIIYFFDSIIKKILKK